MRIFFERAGGFAGLRITTAIDLDQLPEEDANRLLRMLDQCAFFKLPESPEAGKAPDEFTYSITVDEPGRRHTIHTSDTTASAELRELLNELSHRARRRS